ncbi:hypothetical protein M2R47_06380 [Moraxella sp. Tifton1]|uniref:hypothetical protein n=1 Tax=Moraxella oculi TaxID=2940516 RepID=UPI002012C86C|nr:hypothetical protein [Moraxella sp. Tifton1]MCL1623866.1 hypothetical protein [Moraxella sp. Tifton1]
MWHDKAAFRFCVRRYDGAHCQTHLQIGGADDVIALAQDFVLIDEMTALIHLLKDCTQW